MGDSFCPMVVSEDQEPELVGSERGAYAVGVEDVYLLTTLVDDGTVTIGPYHRHRGTRNSSDQHGLLLCVSTHTTDDDVINRHIAGDVGILL